MNALLAVRIVLALDLGGVVVGLIAGFVRRMHLGGIGLDVLIDVALLFRRGRFLRSLLGRRRLRRLLRGRRLALLFWLRLGRRLVRVGSGSRLLVHPPEPVPWLLLPTRAAERPPRRNHEPEPTQRRQFPCPNHLQSFTPTRWHLQATLQYSTISFSTAVST